MKKLIDLHVHSTFSDGTKTPTELVVLAKEKGLSGIAITDHDTTDGVEEAILKGQKQGVEVVPGVEISTEYDREVHILGLFIDYNSINLKVHLKSLVNARLECNNKIIENLQSLGFDLTLEEVQQMAIGEVIGRPHIADAMIKKGYVKNHNEAFEEYIGIGKIAYEKKVMLPSAEAIELIIDARGIPILAHPGIYKKSPDKIEEMVIDLKKHGLMGMEVYHSDHNQETTKMLLSVAKKHDMLISGGSDYHGGNKPDIELGEGFGNLKIDYSLLEKMKNVKHNNI